ncbi:hypothetical protein HKX48_001752 [Thoreauomyces humboldtii]|nr:hypothetical protein HKX48_001752 [Thoreauomyces humboldtii]
MTAPLLVNDDQTLSTLILDLKFTTYVFNSLICSYALHFFSSNRVLWAAATSSICGTLATLLAATYNRFNDDGTLTHRGFYAFLAASELMWAVSEGAAASTTWWKLQKAARNEKDRRKNRRLALAMAGLFVAARDYDIYLAHMAYYNVLVLIDTILTYDLVATLFATATDVARRTHEEIGTTYASMANYVLFGSVSRTIGMNLIMFVLGLTYLVYDDDVASGIQNVMYSFKYNFGIVFLFDVMMLKGAIGGHRNGSAAADDDDAIPTSDQGRVREETDAGATTTTTRGKPFVLESGGAGVSRRSFSAPFFVKPLRTGEYSDLEP